MKAQVTGTVTPTDVTPDSSDPDISHVKFTGSVSVQSLLERYASTLDLTIGMPTATAKTLKINIAYPFSITGH